MRQFIKNWCISCGIVGGVFLTPYDKWFGLYVLLMGIVTFVMYVQDHGQVQASQRKTKILVDILREQFGEERALEIIDEHFVRKGYVDQNVVDKVNAEMREKHGKF